MTVSVQALQLGFVHLPEWHPRAADRTSLIQGFAIVHPDGVIVYDTGVADDHPLINELYSPAVTPIVDALHCAGIDDRDVVAIVNSHLHFDHCGQNRALPGVPVWMQATECELIETPHFTVPEWAHVAPDRRRIIDGDAALAEGIMIVATPGHTPGHQSVVIVGDGRTTVIGGQCCYTCAEFVANAPADEDAHDEAWRGVATESIERLHRLGPDVVHLSHDPNVWRRR